MGVGHACPGKRKVGERVLEEERRSQRNKEPMVDPVFHPIAEERAQGWDAGKHTFPAPHASLSISIQISSLGVVPHNGRDEGQGGQRGGERSGQRGERRVDPIQDQVGQSVGREAREGEGLEKGSVLETQTA